MKARFINEMEFNFKEPPYKKYVSNRGVSRPPTENPRKKSQGLTGEEQEIIDRHEKALTELEGEIEIKEDEIIEINYEIDQLSGEQDSDEVEQFDSEVIQRFGWDALDILNSGISNNDKIKSLDALTPTKDEGDQELINIVSDYDYYHPPEPDEDVIQGYEDEIADIKNDIQKLEDKADKLRTKIYNLQNY